jgi:hypothetical protein
MTRRGLILVEGQTEERFVKDVLTPHFERRALYLTPTVIVTKRVKCGSDFKGGIGNFAQYKDHLQRLFAGSGGALITTLIDYYGLPGDFPGMASRPTPGTPEQRVRHVELQVFRHFGFATNFLPFFMLHEFEALLFSTAGDLPRIMTEPGKQSRMEEIRSSVATPEEINEQPQSAPSKRIVSLFPSYRKALHGPNAAKRIGLDRIRRECPHFNEWLGKLETYAEKGSFFP